MSTALIHTIHRRFRVATRCPSCREGAEGAEGAHVREGRILGYAQMRTLSYTPIDHRCDSGALLARNEQTVTTESLGPAPAVTASSTIINSTQNRSFIPWLQLTSMRESPRGLLERLI